MHRSLIIVNNIYCNYTAVSDGAKNNTHYTETLNSNISVSNSNKSLSMLDYMERFLGHKIINWTGLESSDINGANIRIISQNTEKEKISMDSIIDMNNKNNKKKGWCAIIVLSQNNNIKNLIFHDNDEIIYLNENRLIMFPTYRQCSLISINYQDHEIDTDINNEQKNYFQLFLFDYYPARELSKDYWLMADRHRKWYRKTFLEIELCDQIIKEAETWASENGWTKQRHEQYPTTDIPLKELEIGNQIRNKIINEVFPYLAKKYFFPSSTMSLNDLFVVKYDANGQSSLAAHRDVSILSFNILLNEADEFESGGTYFHHNKSTVTNEKGSIVVHSGKLLHEGKQVTSGTRYILVGFVMIDSSRINYDYINQCKERLISDQELFCNMFLY